MKYQSDPRKNYEEEEIDYDVLSDRNSVASATECTGLMYAPPEDEYEAESYNDIYVIPKVPNEKEKKLR
ncbi:MAG: hypothetical protein E7406_02745 [Ruminococcaceae bacterium]|nr:hypothetical protein [Oscillospiraceae bacterium]